MLDAMKVLIVLTSHDQLGDTGQKTGFWLEEFASPYYELKDAGAAITLASPMGGQPPVDPKSQTPSAQTEATRRFEDDPESLAAMANTAVLAELDAADFDAVFYPGGHGPLWDLAKDASSIALIERFTEQDKVVAAVCHASAALVNAKRADGRPLVEGKRVTGFSNDEEAAVNLSEVVPFLLEERLTALGGRYEKGERWKSHVVEDGRLITGQNPASSRAVAQALLQQLK